MKLMVEGIMFIVSSTLSASTSQSGLQVLEYVHFVPCLWYLKMKCVGATLRIVTVAAATLSSCQEDDPQQNALCPCGAGSHNVQPMGLDLCIVVA